MSPTLRVPVLGAALAALGALASALLAGLHSAS